MAKSKRRPKPSSADRKSKPPGKAKLPLRLPRPKKTIEEIAAEQGKSIQKPLDELIGMGRDLWKSDQEFEEFLAGIYERRRQGRGE